MSIIFIACSESVVVQLLERIFVRPLGFGQPVLVPGFGGALGPQELVARVVSFGSQGVHGRTEWGKVGYSTHLGMAAGSDLRYC
jgi:hypothetical protein